MTAFTESLKRHIRQNGPIDVGTFMADAVSYYYSHNEPFGQDGDFTTALKYPRCSGK